METLQSSACMRIKEIRTQLNVSQRALARVLGVRPVNMSRWERGFARPSAMMRVILALLESVLNAQPHHVVLGTLRNVGAAHIDRIRALTFLERHPNLTQPLTIPGNPFPAWPVPRPPWTARIAEICGKLALSQDEFADLIGFTAMAVSHWRHGRFRPSDLSEVILELLECVLEVQFRITVLQVLRMAGNEPLALVRALTHLERHPAILVVSLEAAAQRAPVALPAGGALRPSPPERPRRGLRR